jgi:hypothetical protein
MGISTGSRVDQGGCGSSGGGCHDSCSNAVIPERGVLTFDPDTGISSTFEVGEKPVLLHILRNYANSNLTIEAAYGCGAGDEFVSITTRQGAVAFPSGSLPPTQGELLAIVLSGRYRLRGTIGSVDFDDLLVAVRENEVIGEPLLSLMVG